MTEPTQRTRIDSPSASQQSNASKPITVASPVVVGPSENEVEEHMKRIVELEKQNERLLSLVRLQRAELHEQNAITDKEYADLVQQSNLRVLLETHDDLREQLKTQADEIGRLQAASSHNEEMLSRLLDGALIPHDVAGGELLNTAQRLELLIGKLSSMRDALDMVKRKWTFNNNQHHTHTWHDWADCVAVIEQALSLSPPAVERVIICPECYQPCTQDHNSFKCDFCQKLWPRGHGHETYELPDDAPPVQTEEKPADPTKEMFRALDEEECHRERLGRRVREVWIAWANRQPNPKPSWLVPYDELSEADKEADRCIGCTIWGDCIDAHSEAIASHAVKHLQPATVPLAVAEGQWQDIETAPRDGTAVLAMLHSDCPAVVAYSCLHQHWYVKWDGEPLSRFSKPVRWMPLPPAPATFQASTKE